MNKISKWKSVCLLTDTNINWIVIVNNSFDVPLKMFFLSFFLSFFAIEICILKGIYFLLLSLSCVNSFAIFSNVSYNSAAVNAFVEVAQVMNRTRLWDSKLAWYSPNSTRWIHLYEYAVTESTHLGQSDLAWSSRLLCQNKITWTI